MESSFIDKLYFRPKASKKTTKNTKDIISEIFDEPEIKKIAGYDMLRKKYIDKSDESHKITHIKTKKDITQKDITQELNNYAYKIKIEAISYIIYNSNIYDSKGLFINEVNKFITTSCGFIDKIIMYNDSELGEFIKVDNKLYKKISDKYCINVGEIISDDICLFAE